MSLTLVATSPTPDILVAPFTSIMTSQNRGNHFELDTDGIGHQARCFKQTGINGAFICGTNGEGEHMPVTMRMDSIKHWAREQTDSFHIVAHVGFAPEHEILQLARFAESQNVSGIAVAFSKGTTFSSEQELTHTLARIASEAPYTPLYYYDFPDKTEIKISALELLKHARAIPSFAGIKFTNSDMDLFLRCQEYINDQQLNNQITMFSGKDECFLAAWKNNGRHFVSGTSNIFSPLLRAIAREFVLGNGEEAQRLQLKVLDFVGAFASENGNFIAAAKGLSTALLCRRNPGFEISPEVFPWATKLTPEQNNQIIIQLINLEIGTWINTPIDNRAPELKK